jgi:hypothetical protein
MCLVLNRVVVGDKLLPRNVFYSLHFLIVDNGPLHWHLIDVLARFVVNILAFVGNVLHSALAAHWPRRHDTSGCDTRCQGNSRSHLNTAGERDAC